MVLYNLCNLKSIPRDWKYLQLVINSFVQLSKGTIKIICLPISNWLLKMYQTQEIHYSWLAWFLLHEIKMFADPFPTCFRKTWGKK